MDNTADTFASQGPGFFELMQVAGGLLLILGVIFVAFWLLKKYGHKAGIGSSAKGKLRIVGALSLGHKRNLVLVRFLNKVMLLGVTDHGITLLSETDEEHDDIGATSFSQTLSGQTHSGRSRSKAGDQEDS